MKPPPLTYVAARSVAEALSVLAEAGGTAKLLAGGQSLMPMLNFRLLRPAILLDINRIDGLAGVTATDTGLMIGAMTRHAALEAAPLIRRHFPIIAAAMGHVAHLAIRNRGTIGGSLAHADPAAELPMLARLLGARIHTVTPSGAHVHEADAFFVAALTTALAADEIISHVELPFLPQGSCWGFEEFARRRGDYALAAVAATLAASDGRTRHVRLAMMGVGDTPLRATAAEAVLEGATIGADRIDAAIAAMRNAVTPSSDLHASADYRRHLLGVLARRAILAAWRRARSLAADSSESVNRAREQGARARSLAADSSESVNRAREQGSGAE